MSTLSNELERVLSTAVESFVVELKTQNDYINHSVSQPVTPSTEG